MKKYMFALVFAAVAAASCGGGETKTPVTTADSTKVDSCKTTCDSTKCDTLKVETTTEK